MRYPFIRLSEIPSGFPVFVRVSEVTNVRIANMAQHIPPSMMADMGNDLPVAYAAGNRTHVELRSRDVVMVSEHPDVVMQLMSDAAGCRMFETQEPIREVVAK